MRVSVLLYVLFVLSTHFFWDTPFTEKIEEFILDISVPIEIALTGRAIQRETKEGRKMDSIYRKISYTTLYTCPFA